MFTRLLCLYKSFIDLYFNMSLRKNIGLAQFYRFFRATITSTSRPRKRYILSFGIHELFHLIINTNSKLLQKRRLFVLQARRAWMHMLLMQWSFGTFFAKKFILFCMHILFHNHRFTSFQKKMVLCVRWHANQYSSLQLTSSYFI